MERTLILACWPVADPLLASLEEEPALLEVAGKSLLQRSVEQAVALGARRLDVVLGDNAEPYEKAIGDGERWGCEIVYHYARPGSRPLRAFSRQIAREAEYLVLHADRNLPPGHVPRSGRLGCWLEGGDLHWCGWGRLSGGLLADCLEEAESRQGLERLLLANPRLWCEATPPPSRGDTAAGLLAAARRLLRAPEQPVGIARNPDAPGLWIGNGCRIHPTAVITAPAYLGDHVFVGPGAIIGPDAVIGARSIIDRDATVIDALVRPESYLGAGAELRQSVLCGGKLVNVALGVALEIPDRELAGLATAARGAMGPGIGERLLASLLWAALLPLRPLAAAAGAGPDDADAYTAILRGVPGAWLRHFREDFHPGLAQVARGRLRLVGLRPRTPTEIAALPPAWQRLYRHAGPGLLNDALLLGAEGADPAIGYAGDVLATKKLQIRHLWASVRRYAARVRTDWQARHAACRPNVPVLAGSAGRGE